MYIYIHYFRVGRRIISDYLSDFKYCMAVYVCGLCAFNVRLKRVRALQLVIYIYLLR